jgi:hypothetical protein
MELNQDDLLLIQHQFLVFLVEMNLESLHHHLHLHQIHEQLNQAVHHHHQKHYLNHLVH